MTLTEGLKLCNSGIDIITKTIGIHDNSAIFDLLLAKGVCLVGLNRLDEGKEVLHQSYVMHMVFGLHHNWEERKEFFPQAFIFEDIEKDVRLA